MNRLLLAGLRIAVTRGRYSGNYSGQIDHLAMYATGQPRSVA